MLFYWDTPEGNSWEAAGGLRYQLQAIRQDHWDIFLKSSVHTVSKDYTQPGIWMVSLVGVIGSLVSRKHGLRTLSPSIPEHVKQGLRDGKLILLVDNSMEGRDLTEAEIVILHESILEERLPARSIVVVTGSVDTENVYLQRVRKLAVTRPDLAEPMISFTYLSCCPDQCDSESELPILQAMRDPDAKDFMSLNHTVKHHRMEHVYWILKNGFKDRGLINASWLRNGDMEDFTYRQTPRAELLYNAPDKTYDMLGVTHNHLPLSADYDLTEAQPNDLPKGHGFYNSELFKKSLLSFVTESEYVEQESVFVTEKTYKALLAGHPFMVLSPAGTLRYLEAQGFRTDMCDIDPSYDMVTDEAQRFQLVHRELEKWINTSLEQKHTLIHRDMHKLKHNRDLCNRFMKTYSHTELAHWEQHTPEICQTSLWKNFWEIEVFLKAKLDCLENG
jgi:hypothetical protein